MSGLTRAALDRRTVTTVFLTLLFLWGISLYPQLPRAEDPGFTPRTAVVTARFPGAEPELVERLVTDPMEVALQDIEEIDHLASESRRGESVIFIHILETETEIRPLWDEVRRRMRDLEPSLPEGVIGPSVDDDFGDVYSILLGLTGDGFTLEELEDLADDLREPLLELDDVGKVEIVGAPRESVFVRYERARLARLGLTPQDLARALRSRNVVAPGGFVRTEETRIPLAVGGAFDDIEAIRGMALPVGVEGGAGAGGAPLGETTSPGSAGAQPPGLLRLGDVAEVRRGIADPPQRLVRLDGTPGVVLGVSMKPDGKITRMGPAVLELAEQAQADLPAGVTLERLTYRTEIVEGNIQNFVSSLLQGVVAVFLVMLVALGLRTGVVVATVVPMTMVASLIVMSLLGISLNKMSLAALILALGLLVDNAIVISEAIIVGMEEGQRPVDAAVEAVSELRLPLLVASVTTAAALLPTYLAESAVGEYTSAIFEVVSIALLISWGLALTMMPLLCVTFLRPKGRRGSARGSREDDEHGPETAARDQGEASGDQGSQGGGFGERVADRIRSSYRGGLRGMLRHRVLTLVVMVGLLGVALWAARFVPQSFFPRKQESLFTVAIELPYGTPFDRTAEVVGDLEAFMDEELAAAPTGFAARYDEEGVIGWGAFIGSGAPRFILGYAPEPPRPNYAYLLVNTSSHAAQDWVIPRMRRFLASRHPEATSRLQKLRNGPPIDYPFELRLSGPDQRVLDEIVARGRAELRKVEGAVNVGTNWPLRRARVDVQVDDASSRFLRRPPEAIAAALDAHLDGTPVDVLRAEDDPIPIVLRSTTANTPGLDALDRLPVPVGAGRPAAPLGRLADLELGFEPGEILRRDGVRTVTLRADLAPNAPASVSAFSIAQELRPWLEAQAEGWPVGYEWAFGGEVESSGDAQGAIREKMPIALVIILLLLVVQFDAIRPPLVVLGTLPFALIGVILGLLVTQKPFGFVALLGVIALFGIVINNALVLLDRVEIEMEMNGLSRAQAVERAAERRFRPVLLTTATTAGGLLPLWFGGGPMFSPMAVAIFFGLILSTAVTLGLAPVLYSLAYRLDHRPPS